MLRDAWRAGTGPRLIVLLGLAVTAVWAVVVTAGTFRFIVSTVTNPALAWPFKAGMAVVVPVVMVFLVVSLPMNWMTFFLVWLDERNRSKRRRRE